MKRIKNLVDRACREFRDVYWIGLNDRRREGVWQYLDDALNRCNATVYVDFHDGQPNDGLRGSCGDGGGRRR